jgi:membrane-associated protein
MDSLASAVDLIVHLNVHLQNFAAAHGGWIYALLFAIIFVETGFVVTPFLPGDALLFAVGALCGVGAMNLAMSIVLLTAAAIAGNQCNYAIGHYLGPKVFRWQSSRFFNRHSFDLTHAFYQRHGGLTIVAARFIPLLRSFAPFVAGVADMEYGRFTFFDVAGGALWVASLTIAGCLFGNIPWVQSHFDSIILVLLGTTIVMAMWSVWRGRLAQRPRA